jgi:hypothetical protein
LSRALYTTPYVPSPRLDPGFSIFSYLKTESMGIEQREELKEVKTTFQQAITNYPYITV